MNVRVRGAHGIEPCLNREEDVLPIQCSVRITGCLIVQHSKGKSGVAI